MAIGPMDIIVFFHMDRFSQLAYSIIPHQRENCPQIEGSHRSSFNNSCGSLQVIGGGQIP